MPSFSTNVFNVNFGVLVRQVLPVRWRNAVMIAWCNALVSPVVYVQGLFDANRAADLYVLSHNGQCCYLQAALNDLFDNALRRIYISNRNSIVPSWWALDSENKPEWWALDSEDEPAWWPLDSELSNLGFTVNVPSALTFSNAQMVALVNKYKLPGTVYRIVTF